MSPVHRDGEGRPTAETTWGGVADRLIVEAQERGLFDDLPLHGKPLPRPDTTYAGEMAAAFSVLRNAGVSPPWIEADKEVRRLLEQRDALLASANGARAIRAGVLRRRHGELVRRVNAAIEQLNALAPSDRQHRRRLDPSTAAAELEEHLAGAP